MAIKVCKFGGTSMADGNVIAGIKNILNGDPQRRYIVVSAPGKRYSEDKKVTDLLLACHRELVSGGDYKNYFFKAGARFKDISRQLSLKTDIDGYLAATLERIENERSEEFTASRGEYLCALLAAEVFGAEFIDAEDIVFFDKNGSLDGDKTYKAVSNALSGVKRAVIPGFYGKGADGKVKTFSRGGSDISGAIIARAVNACVYENWTDVSGFLACDPHIVNSPKSIKTISYKELRELSYMGANVLHSESIFPVRKANIPIHIKNTFRPEDEGTTIVPTSQFIPHGNTVTGIAGRKNFIVIYIEKSLMNAEIGFVRKVLSVVEENGVPVEHIPSGIDTMSLVIAEEGLTEDKLKDITEGIKAAVHPDVVRVIEDIALIATVGHGMSSLVGTSARLFNAIAAANINIKMIDQGSSELNIIIGVKNSDYERCIKAIYDEFFSKR